MPVRIELRGARRQPVQAFHTALAALVAPRLRRAAQVGDYADALAFIGLLKRSVSTISACVNTLQVVAERYRLLRRRLTPRHCARNAPGRCAPIASGGCGSAC